MQDLSNFSIDLSTEGLTAHLRDQLTLHAEEHNVIMLSRDKVAELKMIIALLLQGEHKQYLSDQTGRELTKMHLHLVAVERTLTALLTLGGSLDITTREERVA